MGRPESPTLNDGSFLWTGNVSKEVLRSLVIMNTQHGIGSISAILMLKVQTTACGAEDTNQKGEHVSWTHAVKDGDSSKPAINPSIRTERGIVSMNHPDFALYLGYDHRYQCRAGPSFRFQLRQLMFVILRA